MVWIDKVELGQGSARKTIHPTHCVAHAKVFDSDEGLPILQIHTAGSQDRQKLGGTSQTLQFGRESAEQLFLILKNTFDFQ